MSVHLSYVLLYRGCDEISITELYPCSDVHPVRCSPRSEVERAETPELHFAMLKLKGKGKKIRETQSQREKGPFLDDYSTLDSHTAQSEPQDETANPETFVLLTYG